MAAHSADKEAGFFLPHLSPGMNLLDGGCGPGAITTGLANAVSPGLVTALDINQGQLIAAETHCKNNGIDNVEFQQGSLTELPFGDAIFDAAFTHTVIEHVADPNAAVAEIFRVLKPGGVFGARHLVAASGSVLSHVTPTREELNKRRGCGSDSGDVNLDFGLVQTGIMSAAGFEIIGLTSSTQHFGQEQMADLEGALSYYQPHADTEEEMARLRSEFEPLINDPHFFLAVIAIETVGKKLR